MDSLKLVDKFTCLGSSVSSTEKDIDTQLTKAWTAIDRLSIIWKSDLTDKMKRSFSQAAVVSILLHGCTTWMLTKRLKKLDGNYTRMLRAILNKSWWQHPTRHQLYGQLPPVMKTMQVRRTRHAGHCWRSKDELISDVLQWTPAYGLAKAGRPARTYIQQLCEDTGCSPENLPEAMNDRGRGERGSGISVLAVRHDDDDVSHPYRTISSGPLNRRICTPRTWLGMALNRHRICPLAFTPTMAFEREKIPLLPILKFNFGNVHNYFLFKFRQSPYSWFLASLKVFYFYTN